MIPSFYFLRHGLTDANVQKLLCGGDWDISLNSEGQSQAAKAARAYAKALADVRTICCSPLLRAQETAACFAKELQVPIVIVNDLKEQLLGQWERKPWQDVPEFFTGEKDPPQGESREQFDERLRRGLLEASRQDGPLLLVSHGAVWFALHRLLGLKPEQPGSCVPFYFQQGQTSFQCQKLEPSC